MERPLLCSPHRPLPKPTLSLGEYREEGLQDGELGVDCLHFSGLDGELLDKREVEGRERETRREGSGETGANNGGEGLARVGSPRIKRRFSSR